MAKLRLSWKQKLLDDKDLPRVVEVNEKMSRRWGEGTFVIPAPVEVDGIMKQVPPGRLITINQIREALAKRHNANFGWPLTTGIFAGIAARASEEEAAEGKEDITPYWRTLKAGGLLNEKYPGGLEEQADKLKAEGHEIETGKNGKPRRVKGWESKLAGV